MYLLGIDPGLATTGFAIVRTEASRKPHIEQYGIIKTPAGLSLGERLVMIRADLVELLEKYTPEHVGIEEVFFGKNVTTAMHVSHARGVIVEECARRGMPIAEFNPMQVKLRITGDGRADKKQVQSILGIEFGLQFASKHDDAADAIAIALCLMHSLRTSNL
ncbi:crossover junction endodeoxyribonuclease RuvC [Candidatus Gracilibacteria bacterium CG17_big_fil_post_rev_8_21_14_2_50_48_13]|nr:MAG: crossover junction endodeoxyribonuclease RuvC [Candidatus Gracilibacteria bacterium CG17_big_fil_post_rev_8_21_14_2_50_48_13]